MFVLTGINFLVLGVISSLKKVGYKIVRLWVRVGEISHPRPCSAKVILGFRCLLRIWSEIATHPIICNIIVSN